MDSKHTGIIYDKVESRKYRSCAQLRKYNETVPDGWTVYITEFVMTTHKT